MEVFRWQLQQQQVTTPSRLGRGGLKPGKTAPDFKLPTVAGKEIALSDYAGRQVFLVFVQTGCRPCTKVTPDLNQMHRDGTYQVLVVNNAEPDKARQWALEHKAEFPVLIQEKWTVSKRYEVFATPFAFLIDEKSVVKSKGIVSNKQHIGFVLEGRGDNVKDDLAKEEETKEGHAEADQSEADAVLSNGSVSHSQAKEVQHV